MWLFVIILLGGIYQSISYFKQYVCKTVLLSSVIKIDVERSFVCAYSYIKQINICHVFVQNLDIGHVYIYSQIKQDSQKPIHLFTHAWGSDTKEFPPFKTQKKYPSWNLLRKWQINSEQNGQFARLLSVKFIKVTVFELLSQFYASE